MRITLFFLLLLPFLIRAGVTSGQDFPLTIASQKQDSRSELDTIKVRNLYHDGDFDLAISILENGLKDQLVKTHADSVFVFKHLGVMYAASEKNRERGKYFMFQLLSIEPTARIMDMYASDMIYMIFKNVQEEFSISRGKYLLAEKLYEGNTKEADTVKSTSPKLPRAAEESKKSHAKTYFWVGATTAIIGVGVVVYLLTESPSVKSNNYEVK